MPATRGGGVHQFRMGDVAVGKDHLADAVAADQFGQIFLWMDRDAGRVERTRQGAG